MDLLEPDYGVIRRALAAGDGKALQRELLQLGQRILLEGRVSHDHFRELTQLLLSPLALESKASHHLVHFFLDNLDFLSAEQRAALLANVERAFPAFADWMSCFTASELIGDWDPPDAALDALLRLRRVEGEMPRSFVPHGFEHVARRATGTVQEKARDELVAMLRDASDVVRQEAAESLARLARHSSG